MLRADDLGAALGTKIERTGPDRLVLAAAGTSIEFTIGVPFARVGTDVTPLVPAPVASQGVVLLPVSVATDLLPRVAAGFQFDASRVELRRFRPVVASLPKKADPPLPARRPERSMTEPPERQEHVVVVDAGHGGQDRGMSGPIRGGKFRIYEADITLQVARRVRDVLQSKGVRVIMTRDRDTLIALGDRGRIANRAGGNLFISIHVNAANPRWRDPGAARGFETYFLAEAKTEDERRVEQLENEAVKYDAEVETSAGDALSFILNDMKQNEHLRESSDLAATMQRSLAKVLPGPDRGVKQAGFMVLVSAYMPAVLVEIGFGTNIPDARFMASATGQQILANTIAEAATSYLAQLERRTSVGASR